MNVKQERCRKEELNNQMIIENERKQWCLTILQMSIERRIKIGKKKECQLRLKIEMNSHHASIFENLPQSEEDMELQKSKVDCRHQDIGRSMAMFDRRCDSIN